ncbi:peptidase M61 [Reichenbachiella sp. MALMAid0571]|uniref:M61 family metallopeptidase n=1 Tax=Reichenbachiella sp. MALMAid0571 TaxID=3143939 RepID=UPI0032E05333
MAALSIKKISILTVALCFFFSFRSIAQPSYEVFIDLNKVVDDKVKVTIEVPEISEERIEYHIPKIVPGTYSVYDFGRFISNFLAIDSNGNQLKTDSISPNRRLIYNANKLHKISYWVEDTYDSKKNNFIFEPAGSNIEEGKNFIINTYAFIGYLDNYKNLPYNVHIKHPGDLFGSTALPKTIASDSIDIFTTNNYFDLADGPIMYCVPDTTTFEMGGAKILVSVYSPNKIATSGITTGYIKETLEAQKDYLGGKLPIDRYAFLIYHFSGVFSGSLALGALEHSYSSLYSLPELHPILISQTIKDFTAHEFFHIVTPLNIHSEEIGNFDFIQPKMSKHLWLYEGVTEYAAGLAQVKYGKMDARQYLEVLLEKIKSATRYDQELPFTELSKKCLHEYKFQYGNVYQKGALIGLCLDIRLRELSNGKYGIQDMMQDLSKKFGKENSFRDDELFDIITELTFPEIRDFFTQYVEGSSPLPLESMLEKVGVIYTSREIKKEVSLGGINFYSNTDNGSVIITDTSNLNRFGKELGYQSGDIIHKFDGVKLNSGNFINTFDHFKQTHKNGDKIKVIVIRLNQKGKLKKVRLKGHVIEKDTHTKLDIKPNPAPTKKQKTMRKSWINK